MLQLTSEGQQKVTALAQRYGVSLEAVSTLLQALVHGHGTMAQFDHIPTDLVVAQEALAAESSLRLDFLLLHNFGASFDTP
jgi:hypothetical protein